MTNLTWPAGAIIIPLFTPFIRPNRTINCTAIDAAAAPDSMCTALPEFSDTGYPRVNGTSWFRTHTSSSSAESDMDAVLSCT